MIEELKVIISAEFSKFKKSVDEAQRETKKFSEQVKEAGKNVGNNMKSMGDAAASAGKAIALGLAGAVTALVALGASTAEYRNEQAKLVTAFESAGSSASQAKETYNDLYRVLGDSGTATEAASHLAKLTTGQKELGEWTNICQGVYATFGDSLPIESLTEAANETAKTGALTGGLADALNWAGVNEEEFQAKLDATNSEAEREQLIRETLNGLYSDAAAKYEENNAQILAQNEAQASLQETTAKLGEAMAPVVTLFTQFASDALAAIIPYIQPLAEKLMPTLQTVLEGVATALESTLKFITEHQTLLAVMAGIIGGIVTAIGLYNAVAAIKTAMDTAGVASVWGLVAAHTAQAVATMAALAPYLLIVAAIAAVIAIIVLCIKYWDEIVAAIKKAIDWIVEALGAAVDWVVEAFSKAWEGIKSAFASVGNFFAGIWQGIKNAFSGVANWFGNVFSKAWEAVKNVFSKGGKIFDGIKDGILNGLKTVINGIIGGINKVIKVPFDGLNSALKKIKGISIAGLKPFSWISTLNVPQIPKLARGGIIDSATLAMIGEQGKEAVVPLENNLEWMDKLATMLSARIGGSNAPIVLEVDGKVFAQTAINTINANTRQTGKLQLTIR